MAWKVEEYALQMAEGDYGIKLPFTINGTELTANDTIEITFKRVKNGDDILVKPYTGSAIVNNGFDLELTKEESDLFRPGCYVYRLDWYQNGIFMCNIILCGMFKVVDKA